MPVMDTTANFKTSVCNCSQKPRHTSLGTSININVHHNPNNVWKVWGGGGGGGGANGHVRIVFQVRTLVHQISMFIQYEQWERGKCHVRIAFLVKTMTFWPLYKIA